MANYLIRVHLPDRPGALGAVASRIGAVGGDVVSIDILQREQGSVIDDFGVELAGEDLVELLRSEILEVDGVTVEALRLIDGPVPERHAEILDIATSLFHQTSPTGVLEYLTNRACESVNAS
ncbi:MAG TPA: ACT domain-containing protein, partial [Acidimicrobiales bacterium]|nr:ACT domain-containing protein [Acidimicrobiales bacterium]